METKITPHGSPETFDEYMHGAIDALLSVERIPDFDSFANSEKNNTPITFIFKERVPLKAFVNACNFIKRFGIDEQLWIVPTSDGTIKIQFS
ncbi:MAG: hypothetical protein II937_09585 [Bacteroidales bacterium]|nr:hypothetical protein [Bacteroidales bacterium]